MGLEFLTFTTEEELTQQLKAWEKEKVLLCIDCPLGWPMAFQKGFKNRGPSIASTENVDVDDVFLRLTDRVILQALKKRPLEVAADRLARAAVRTLHRLDEMNTNWSEQIAFNHQQLSQVTFRIAEVYPAATIASTKKLSTVKGNKSNAYRREYVAELLDALFESPSLRVGKLTPPPKRTKHAELRQLIIDKLSYNGNESIQSLTHYSSHALDAFIAAWTGCLVSHDSWKSTFPEAIPSSFKALDINATFNESQTQSEGWIWAPTLHKK